MISSRRSDAFYFTVGLDTLPEEESLTTILGLTNLSKSGMANTERRSTHDLPHSPKAKAGANHSRNDRPCIEAESIRITPATRKKDALKFGSVGIENSTDPATAKTGLHSGISCKTYELRFLLSIIHTPVLPVEVRSIFRITPNIYKMAIINGAIQKSYTDFYDPAKRFRMHNISDTMFFAVMLTLGWPIVPVTSISDEAEYISDDLAYAWEGCEENLEDSRRVAPYGCPEETSTALFSNIQLGIHSTVDSIDYLSNERKSALRRHINNILGFLVLCCAKPEGNSIRETSVVADLHEQTYPTELQD